MLYFINFTSILNAILVRNEEITPCNFLINPLKIHGILKKK